MTLRLVTIAGLIGALLLSFLVGRLAPVAGRPAERPVSSASLSGWLFALVIVSVWVLGFTGFSAVVFDKVSLRGIWLMLHVASGGVFVGALAVYSVLLFRDSGCALGKGAFRYWVNWFLVALGLAVSVPMLLSMTPYFHQEHLEALNFTHRWLALVLATGLLATNSLTSRLLQRRQT